MITIKTCIFVGLDESVGLHPPSTFGRKTGWDLGRPNNVPVLFLVQCNLRDPLGTKEVMKLFETVEMVGQKCLKYQDVFRENWGING